VVVLVDVDEAVVVVLVDADADVDVDVAVVDPDAEFPPVPAWSSSRQAGLGLVRHALAATARVNPARVSPAMLVHER
jgi:hypothetical protein